MMRNSSTSPAVAATVGKAGCRSSFVTAAMASCQSKELSTTPFFQVSTTQLFMACAPAFWIRSTGVTESTQG